MFDRKNEYDLYIQTTACDINKKPSCR